jgi:hypothetical protein
MADSIENTSRRGAGQMSVEDILRTDWEKNYKDKGVSYEEARASFKGLIDSGFEAGRIGNTIVFFKKEGDGSEALFHTITADEYEQYFYNVLRFLMALYKKREIGTVFTHINDKKIFNKIRKNLGSYVIFEPNEDDPSRGKYKLTLEIGAFTVDMERQKGAENGLV